MILLAHMLFGAAIGAQIKYAPWAIILAFLGHYFLDIFPHIEYLDGVEDSIKKLKIRAWQKNMSTAAKVLIDFCLGLFIITLFSRPLAGGQLIIYVCALVAIVPDGMTVLHSLFPNLGLEGHHYIHSTKIHYLTKQKKFPVFWRIATQVLVVVISFLLLRQ